MTVRLVFSALLLAFASLVGADDKKDEKKDSKPATITSIQLPVPKSDTAAGKAYAEIFTETNVELKTAKPEDTNAVFAATAAKIVTAARKYPSDEASLDALVMAISLSSRSPDAAKARGEAIELVKTNFAKSPAIRKKLRQLASGIDDAGADIVRGVLKDHPEMLTRAHAAKALISGLEMRMRMAEAVGKNEAVRASYEKAMGKDTIQKLIDGVPQDKKQIEEYRTVLRTELKGQLPDLEVGAVAPETISVNLDGKSVKLSELKGKVVVLDFWATWCGPCRAMIPHTRDLVKGMDGKPFVFVSVSVDDEKETLTKFIEKTPMPWAHWWDGKKAASEQWDVEGYPTLYVIDHKGVIRFKTLGYDPKSGKLDATVEELVKAAEAGK